jgi:putative membrane protein
MEREKRIKRNVAVIIIVVFHIVGALGLHLLATKPLFLQLVPYHLMVMAVVVIAAHRRPGKNFLQFISLVAVSGLVVEWIGIHTGLLFGNYVYGTTLGPKVSGVPLIMGVNWFLLIYSTSVFMQRSKIRNARARIVAGAVVLTLLDVLIEPSALKLNYWTWLGSEIPDLNYICWFLFSALFLFVFERMKFVRQSIVGEVFLIVQFLFFASLQV